mgnify:CR=1 FL=1
MKSENERGHLELSIGVPSYMVKHHFPKLKEFVALWLSQPVRSSRGMDEMTLCGVISQSQRRRRYR